LVLVMNTEVPSGRMESDGEAVLQIDPCVLNFIRPVHLARNPTIMKDDLGFQLRPGIGRASKKREAEVSLLHPVPTEPCARHTPWGAGDRGHLRAFRMADRSSSVALDG
jgi:hypothetical protein